MSSFSIKADVKKNRLYLSLAGFMEDDQINTAVDVLIGEVKKLKPGFAVINDISSFKPATKTGAEGILRGQLFAKQNGMGKVIRVVGTEGLASMQFSRIGKTSGYEADETATIEDAEKLLDKSLGL